MAFRRFYSDIAGKISPPDAVTKGLAGICLVVTGAGVKAVWDHFVGLQSSMAVLTDRFHHLDKSAAVELKDLNNKVDNLRADVATVLEILKNRKN
mmetsp:Transcript_15521/g.38657  ORF Transcript_15521/g.38657 Transcript_15521/m.38657 type:complete len:95 (-) Transcript_15521:858-1142(-)